MPISIAHGIPVPRNAMSLGLEDRYAGIPRADCDAKQIVSTIALKSHGRKTDMELKRVQCVE
jgi:hypothetical protein